MTQLVQLRPLFSPNVSPFGPVTDTFGRTHSDLRISVTDRCNIRCFYCMPESSPQFRPRQDQITFAEGVRLAKLAAGLGFNKVRLTGGEPLLRPRLPEFVAALVQIPAVRDLALTTNAVLLSDHAQALYDAGLRRLNIHLDTVDRDRFRAITRRDDLGRVLAGIDRAQAVGFRQIKINAVAIKDLTEPDLTALVRFGRERGIAVRFIEFMPLDSQHLWSLDRILTADEMIRTLSAEFGPLLPVGEADSRAPATEYRFENGDRVGFIASVSRPFCGSCNRLRLTADGKLRYCLFAQEETDIRPLLQRPDSDAEIEAAIRSTVWSKWAGHEIGRPGFAPPARPMYSIGG